LSGKSRGEQRTGLLNGLAAYGIWGLVPLFWPLLIPAGAVEILAHRMVWSLVFVALTLLVVRRWAWAGALLRQPRRLGLVTVAAAVITVNWGVYIWSVNNGHVVESSLGYFINPLVTIAMGVLLLKERLRPVQWAAVLLSAVAVVVLTVGYGRPPWISLCLAFSFATYGLVKKKVGLDGVESLAAETAVQFLPALAYLLWLGAQGRSTFTTEGAGHAVLLACTGIVTALAGTPSEIPSDTTDVFAVEDVYALHGGLGSRYRRMASWLGNTLTYNLIRQFDTAGWRYGSGSGDYTAACGDARR